MTDSVLTYKTNEYTGTMYPVPKLDQFTLSEYLGQYKGMVKVNRAIYIGERSTELAVESYTIALKELHDNTLNVPLYEEVVKRLRQLGALVERDGSWVEKTRNDSRSMRDMHKNAVAKAVSQSLKKEAMREQRAYAQYESDMGFTDEAIRAWQDGRDFCTSVEEQAMLFVEAARVSQIAFRWLQVGSFIQRAALTLAKSGGDIQSELDVLQLQSNAGDGRWAAVVAAVRALAYDGVAANGIFERGAISPHDIALYGTLAGLASLNRDAIKTGLIDNVAFGKYLDHIPECQRLLQSFYAARYSECLERLDNVLSLAVFDPVIAQHASSLRAVIRENIVVLYTQPFVSTRLDTMAQALGFASRAALENVLVRLIEKKQIVARIDGTSGYLVKYTPSPRDVALESIERMYDTFSLQSDLLLARIHFLEAETAKGGR
ncbi:hypothetical protein GGI07_002208 [Coemansia sp. Benny D115]|nr:hypothetical protein GGI07_002208 [Coemansia sp. Benny D115]